MNMEEVKRIKKPPKKTREKPIKGGSYWNQNWESGYLGGGNVFIPLNKRVYL